MSKKKTNEELLNENIDKYLKCSAERDNIFKKMDDVNNEFNKLVYKKLYKDNIVGKYFKCGKEKFFKVKKLIFNYYPIIKCERMVITDNDIFVTQDDLYMNSVETYLNFKPATEEEIAKLKIEFKKKVEKMEKFFK